MTDDRLALDFLGTFESLRMGPTFARGRRDERAGHVRALTVSSSLAVALVRGPEDPKAFRARIAVRSFGASEWARVEKALVAEARFTAALLAGRMPPGMTAVFAAAGLSLLPLSLDEVAMDCTCEQWPMPCVHLAAACYALARSFEEDPFGVFAWRGRARDELLLRLRDLRTASALESHTAGLSPRSAFGPAGSGPPASGGAASGGAASGGAASGGAASGGAASGGAASGGAASGIARDSGVAAGAAGFGVGGGAAVGDEVGEGGSEGHDGGAGGGDLSDLSAFWGVEDGRGTSLGEPPGAVSQPDALLDQLDPPLIAHQGRPIVDLLRPAYRALPEG